MYETCPKCSYQRRPEEKDDPDRCPGCGIFFSKWLKAQLSDAQPAPTGRSTRRQTEAGNLDRLKSLFTHVEEKTNPFEFWGRVFVLVLMFIWGWRFIQMDFVINPFQIGRSFLHNIDLIFHEAGHIIFIPFGRFMAILGGSLFQVMVPLIVMFTFLIKMRNTFAASAGLWWAGQSLMDLAPYIDDAIDQKLVLLGGRTGADAPGNHDWGNILIDLDMLEKHRQIATLADTGGSILILISLAWGTFILFRQFKNLS